MRDALVVVIGFGSGALSGMFGIGGGIVTTPAVRLLADAPALIAVGTPLPVIVPGALAGAVSYLRHGLSDVKAGVLLGVTGSLTAVLGALATRAVGGSVVLMATSVLILVAAADMVQQTVFDRSSPYSALNPAALRRRLLVIGAFAGAYSGFFGLGGGFVLVPLLSRWCRYPIKRAIGTSLLAVTLLAIPGTVTHSVLGHVDWGMAALLTLGVVPGAVVGARLTARSRDRTTRIGFSVLLVAVAVWLAVAEGGGIPWAG